MERCGFNVTVRVMSFSYQQQSNEGMPGHQRHHHVDPLQSSDSDVAALSDLEDDNGDDDDDEDDEGNCSFCGEISISLI